MGEPSFYCHPSPEGCCLQLHETIVILVALIILVQLALKLATVICYYLCYLLGSLFGMVFAKAPEQARAAAPKPRRAQSKRASTRWSQQDVPRRRLRSESTSPNRRCLHCTLEPLRVTMNLQQESCPFREHPRTGRRAHPDYPPCQAPPARYYNCDCDWRPRPRHASAPSGYGVPRYRDVGCGSSDPLLGAGGSATERRTAPLAGSDPFPRTQVVGETHYRSGGPGGQDADYPAAAAASRARRPAKVYIYPVHPQTPPGSRSASPERSYRRRGAAGLPSQDEPQEYEPREQRRKARDAEQQLGLAGPSRYHNLGMSAASQGGGGTQAAETKQRYYWAESQHSGADWVYRPLK